LTTKASDFDVYHHMFTKEFLALDITDQSNALVDDRLYDYISHFIMYLNVSLPITQFLPITELVMTVPSPTEVPLLIKRFSSIMQSLKTESKLN